MDSTSSNPNRETTPSTSLEDDAFLSLTSSLAKDAFQHFQSRRFSDCIDVLIQLSLHKQHDPKVLHNIAIAEYFRDGCSDPKKLLEVFRKVQKKSEELARASGEQGEAVVTVGNKNSSGLKGTGSMTHQFSSGSSSNLVYMNEFDPTVATLNIAVIWFHLHEYAKALAVLEPLYDNIEPINETTALHICLLLLDVALACQDASKAADVLAYLEKAYGVGCVNQIDGSSIAQQQSANLVAKSSSVPTSASASDADLTSASALESSLSRTLSLSEEPLDYESMFSSLDISGQNQTRMVGVSSANDLPRTSGSIPPIDLKLFKVRFLLVTRNLKQAKREVKLAMNIARGGRDSSVALLLKSQLEYARGNHRKAIKLLMASSSNQTQVGFSSMLNNLGCIYSQLGKYNTSSVFFTRALSVSSSPQKEKPLNLSTFSQDKSFFIIYNCGVQHLACGKPLLAARCFQKASLIFYNRPMLWLRLAECCLIALEKGLIKVAHSPDKSEISVHVIGDGKWRHLAVENGISRNGSTDPVGKEDVILGSDGQPKLSLPFARQCLLNALRLLDCSELSHLKSGTSDSTSEEIALSEAGALKGNHKSLAGIDSKSASTGSALGQVNANGDTKEQKGATSHEIMQNCISFFEDVRRSENQLIKQAILANLAYVELELENPGKALSAAKALLELPECSRVFVFLGHVYAAEALCILNRPKEGAEYLSMFLSGGIKVELPFSQEDTEQLHVVGSFDYEEVNTGSTITAKNFMQEEPRGTVFLKPEEARGTLYANFATMYAMEGELEQAHNFVSLALSLIPNSAEATLTAVYLDLMLGKSQSAISKLKLCSRARFLPRDVQLNKS